LIALGTRALVAHRRLAFRDLAAALADSRAARNDVRPVRDRAFVEICATRLRLRKPVVWREGVAVSPTIKASKYSSTYRHVP
jgi:hypothetical protein